MTWKEDPAGVRPMLASTADAPLEGASLAYEPKYDGIRALVAVEPGRPGPSVRLWSRLGNEKTTQFPEVVAAFSAWAQKLDRPLLLDGEIVALDAKGEPAGFQNLQGRVHLKTPRPVRGVAPASAAIAFIAFDILRDGDEDLRPKPLRDRRARLEKVLGGSRDTCLRISEHAVGDGRPLHARAQALGWEGLIAKQVEAPYKSGRRTPDWRKLKLVKTQTCIIGGWTDPRGSRPFFGALLLGVRDERGGLQYVGHTGAGFTDAELGRVWQRLQALQTKSSPFTITPKTNEKPHWVEPALTCEVKFTEWTADGKLRHPTYLGMRDDVKVESVKKEPAAAADAKRPQRAHPSAKALASDKLTKAAVRNMLDQLDAIQAGGGTGVLLLPGGDRLDVTNLGKLFWPKLKLTKGDLLRHYVRVAPYILPVLDERPLVMKRYPNGIGGKPFYQHRAPDKLPDGVRVATVHTESEDRPHIVGGNVKTLLYTAQLASISQDPWFSRVQRPGIVDHVAIDLDPPDDMPFARVLDVARWVHDELEALNTPGFPKTSGAGGLHIYVPMPPDTPYEAGLIFCQIVATLVAKKHPRVATVERSISARGRRIYVDYLQNVEGKTLASAYSARASDFAGVSAPVTWDEIDEGVTPQDFTVRTFADRLEQAGDIWAALRKAKGADLRAVMKYNSER